MFPERRWILWTVEGRPNILNARPMNILVRLIRMLTASKDIDMLSEMPQTEFVQRMPFILFG
jgi:hypothetical protein